MQQEDLLYQIALTLIPSIGPVQSRNLLTQLGDAKTIFRTSFQHLRRVDGFGEVRARAIRKFSDFKLAEREIDFLEKFSIEPLFLTDPRYPQRLLNCYDAPILLYFKGCCDLNGSRIAAVVGTRHSTSYGKQQTEQLISGLAEANVLVISGLAYGIDSIAHRSAINNGMATVGVLAHGLDQLYPSAHAGLAKEMLANGGLLTEFRSTTQPDRHNFPLRNRIVAGMSDVTIVAETGIRGGSMITAELANGYNRDVLAFPGKNTDAKSQGCNTLILQHKAALLLDASQLLDHMGWVQKKLPQKLLQRSFFPELSTNEELILKQLREAGQLGIDVINARSGLSSSAVAEALLNLELKNVIVSLPGKIFELP